MEGHDLFGIHAVFNRDA